MMKTKIVSILIVCRRIFFTYLAYLAVLHFFESPTSITENQLKVTYSVHEFQLQGLKSERFNSLLVNCSEHGWSPRTKPAILMDGYLFNGETEMLTIRIAELEGIVDYFVVVESSITFSHMLKNTTSTRETFYTFSKFWGDKLILKIVDKFPSGLTPYLATENFIRAQLKEAFIETSMISKLNGTSPSDIIVIVSDVDEIPCEAKLSWLKYCDIPDSSLPARMELEHFYYYSFKWKKTYTWKGGPQAGKLSSMISNEWNPGNFRFSGANGDVWKPCGWHMSYFMPPEEISKKLSAFSHSEFNRPPFTNTTYISQKMKAGEDLFGRAGEDLIRTQNDPLPRLVRENNQFFRHLLE